MDADNADNADKLDGGGRKRYKSPSRAVKPAKRTVKPKSAMKAVKPRKVGRRGGFMDQENQDMQEQQEPPQMGGARKPSAYNNFVKKEMKVLLKSQPNKKVTELMKVIASKWKQHKHK